MAAEPIAAPAAPSVPRPAGVVDLARYRGRTASSAAPAVLPPPSIARPDVARDRSSQATEVAAPVLVPDWAAAPRTRTEPHGVEERVIRRVRLGSVLKMAFGLSLCTVLVVIGAGVLVWMTIRTLGVVENVESLTEDLGWDQVRFNGPAMFRSACIGGAILVVATSFLSVVFAEVFNLLSTITGGLRAEVGPPPLTRRQRRVARKLARGRAAP